MTDPTIIRFLCRLAVDARRTPRDQLLKRMVIGLANHFGASACSIYRYGRLRAAAWAPPGEEITRLEPEDRANLHNLDGRLVQEVLAKQTLVSALDLDLDGDIIDFMKESLGEMDIFAFPLMIEDGPRGALVMYLPEGSRPLNDADVQALMALGEVMEVAEEEDLRPLEE